MDKNYLLETANKLKQVSQHASNDYESKSELLISTMNSLMMERTNLEDFVGEDNISIMKDNHANHVRFISSILRNFNPEVLVHTILWVFRTYMSHGFKTSYWAVQLNTWIEVTKNILDEEAYQEVHPYYKWMQTNIPIFVKVSNEITTDFNILHNIHEND